MKTQKKSGSQALLERPAPHAVTMLKEDHKKVKRLFKEYEESELKETAMEAIDELKVHMKIEEGIFYPAVREKIKGKPLMNEAVEEHHVVKLLISELQDGSLDHARFAAKFTVLAENVKHHIEEEEGEMFSSLKKLNLDLKTLGQEMLEKKLQLQA